jgi:2-amino-4-hydroxy-6-hydroxymethyldihydropteridine diphosphokinase
VSADHKTTAYIGIGSNLGGKRSNCLKAVERMGQISEIELTGRSDWYLTKPVGVRDQDWYVNGVVSMATKISAQDLLKRLIAIEADMGRVRKGRWGPRVIDLDLLLYGQDMIHDDNLTVPHPLMHLRKFVLVPMVQLAPDLIHPVLVLSMAELLRRIPEDGQVVQRIDEE